MSKPGLGLKKLALALVAGLATYAAAEGVASWLYWSGRLEPYPIRVYEKTDPEGNIRADRASGYRVSPRKARLTMFGSSGQVLSRGFFQGNNFGFSDRHDFSLTPETEGELRFAVLGDSLTAGRFIETNWPDRAEALLEERGGPPIRLYNLGIDGGGLGNWASILRRFIGAEGMELDGLIYAVATDDLERPFVWWDDSLGEPGPVGSVSLCYDTTWDPDARPMAPEKMQAGVNSNWVVIAPSRYEAMLRGEAPPPIPRRPFGLYFTPKVGAALRSLGIGIALASTPPPDTVGEREHRRRLLEEMRDFARKRQLRVLVLGLPGTDFPRARSFAERLGADHHDWAGSREMDGDDLKIPIDRHWNQEGSDRFAGLAAPVISEWARADDRAP